MITAKSIRNWKKILKQFKQKTELHTYERRNKMTKTPRVDPFVFEEEENQRKEKKKKREKKELICSALKWAGALK